MQLTPGILTIFLRAAAKIIPTKRKAATNATKAPFMRYEADLCAELLRLELVFQDYLP